MPAAQPQALPALNPTPDVTAAYGRAASALGAGPSLEVAAPSRSSSREGAGSDAAGSGGAAWCDSLPGVARAERAMHQRRTYICKVKGR